MSLDTLSLDLAQPPFDLPAYAPPAVGGGRTVALTGSRTTTVALTGSRTTTIELEGSRVAGIHHDLTDAEAFCRGEAPTFRITMDETISSWTLRFLIAKSRETADDPLIDKTSATGITVQSSTVLVCPLSTDDTQSIAVNGEMPDKLYYEAWRTDSGYEARLAYGEIRPQPQSAYAPP